MLIHYVIDTLIALAIWAAYTYVLILAFKPHPLDKHSIKRRWFTSIGIGLLTVAFFIVQRFPVSHALAWGVILTWVFAVLVFRVQTATNATLVVVPNLLHRTHAQVHLASPTQAFSKQTYRELPILLSRLSELGFETVTLTSPMFVKEKKLRTLERLKKTLSEDIERIEVKRRHWTTVPMGILSLAVAKHLQRAPSLRKVSVTRWHQITLTLIRHTSEKS
ncbi:hypothetical protein [Vibrio jasicida]|uniref:hypothetical protein n=1 Tax=Vibrio jasicida TaxID=766224 RepID=UPI0005F029AD|nr:hypothetical protein [Vibrio jasicida]